MTYDFAVHRMYSRFLEYMIDLDSTLLYLNILKASWEFTVTVAIA